MISLNKAIGPGKKKFEEHAGEISYLKGRPEALKSQIKMQSNNDKFNQRT